MENIRVNSLELYRSLTGLVDQNEAAVLGNLLLVSLAFCA